MGILLAEATISRCSPKETFQKKQVFDLNITKFLRTAFLYNTLVAASVVAFLSYFLQTMHGQFGQNGYDLLVKIIENMS